LQRINRNQSYIEFFHETPQFQDDIERRQHPDHGELLNHPGMGKPGQSGRQAGSKSSLRNKKSIFSDGQNNQREYDNFLDFSSEIEFDERFDKDKFMEDNQAVGSITEG